MNSREKNGDALNRRFAAVLTVCTIAGVALMVVFGALYLAGLPALLDPLAVVEHWDKPSGQFWREMGREKIDGYSWFLGNLAMMDSLSMVGIALLALAPLLAVIFILPLTRGAFVLLYSILVAEFIFSIIRPHL